MKAKQPALIPIILILAVSVSGCTVPGFESIPFIGTFCIPGLTCATVVEYEHDVLLVTTLEAQPSTVSTGQQFRLSAWIENKGAETVPQKDVQSTQVKIKLYDACEGLFKSIQVTCPDQSGTLTTSAGVTGVECSITNILPKQKIPVFWTLIANDKDKIPLETSCNLKVYVQYPYRTKSITSITFVDYVEYQRQLNEGKFTPITSYITEGYGPIKPYLTVEDQQPIPVKNGVASTTTLAFQFKNKGSGFLAGSLSAGSAQGTDPYGSLYSGIGGVQATSTPTIPTSAITIESNVGSGSGDYAIKGEILSAIRGQTQPFQFIGRETPKFFFTIPTPSNNKIEKVATYHVTTSVTYLYEFRKEMKITIKPPLITG